MLLLLLILVAACCPWGGVLCDKDSFHREHNGFALKVNYSYILQIKPTYPVDMLFPQFHWPFCSSTCTYDSPVPTVPLYLLLLCAYCSSKPTVFLYLLFLCTYAGFLCTYFSSVPTAPLCLLFPPVPTLHLFLCTYCFSVLYCSSIPTVPVYHLFLCTYCPLYHHVHLCPLFLYTYCSSVQIHNSNLC